MPFIPESLSRSRAIRVWLGCAALAALGLPVPAAAQGTSIAVSEPEGFAELTREQTLLVDVYFGGLRRGEAMAVVTPEAIRFSDPAAVLALLPALTDRDAVLSLLAERPLAANAALACTPGADKGRCGKLAPETVGVILDRDRFRVDIFLNPKFISAEQALEDRYIPAPVGTPTMVNAIGGVLSGSTQGGRQFYNLQDQLVVAWGERRLRADLSLSSGGDFAAERLSFEWDRPELRYLAGALWAPGDALTGRSKLLGVGIESQIDTRRDREELLGSPIVVFLDRRARIDVIRQGRVLTSAVYEAGNRQIDTSGFPEGSYEITLRIEEAGQPPREETRFYTKSRRIPSLGRTDFLAYAGLLVDGRDPGSLTPSGRPYVQGLLAHRLGELWAVDGSVQATDEAASLEVGLSLLAPFAQVRTAALAQSSGAVGGMIQIGSTGNGPLNFNIDLRHFDIGEGARLTHVFDGAAAARPSYSQAGGVVSYSLAGFRVLGTFFYRDEAGEAARYSIGPAVEWDVLRRGAFKLTLRGDLTATDQGSTGFAGVSLRFAGRRSSLSALAGGRSGSPGGAGGGGAIGALAGAWQTDALGGEISLGAGYDHQPEQDSLVLSSELQHALGSVSGDLVHTDGDGASGSQYAFGFQSSLAVGAGGVRVVGKTTTDAMIAAQVEGARASDRFEVLVNEQTAAVIDGGETAFVRLPSYRAYKVRIRPVGENLLAYDSAPREIGLFPGVVADMIWSVVPVAIKIGRLVDPAGTPIRGASITAKGVWAQTDDDGFFQIEVSDGVALEVVLRDGQRFVLELPDGTREAGIARLGSVVCCETTGLALASGAGRQQN